MNEIHFYKDKNNEDKMSFFNFKNLFKMDSNFSKKRMLAANLKKSGKYWFTETGGSMVTLNPDTGLPNIQLNNPPNKKYISVEMKMKNIEQKAIETERKLLDM